MAVKLGFHENVDKVALFEKGKLPFEHAPLHQQLDSA